MFTLHVVEIYLQTYRHDMTYSVLKLPLNPNQPTNQPACCRLYYFCVSNLWKVFSKYSFRWHSAYFHSTEKILTEFSANYPWTTFRIPQNTPSPWSPSVSIT